jgi:ABC-type sugar transport system substrate-binding protein
MKPARVSALRYAAIVASVAILNVAAVAPTTAAAPTTAQVNTEPAKSFDPVDLTGKRILLVPYHLDNFNAGEQSWRQRFFESEGATVTILNPNQDASKQLTILETAIANDTADLIIWQPIDSVTAPVQIKKIQDAGILQILDFANVPEGVDGLNFSQMALDFSTEYYDAAVRAGEYMQAHPELGPVQIAWMGDLPSSTNCNQREAGLINGIRSVVPGAAVVYEGQATNQAQANTKMTDYLTTGAKFNVFAGCGGSVSLGGIAAIRAAGLGDAANKVPTNVYMLSLDATPPELELLWNPSVSLMGSVFQGPKDFSYGAITLGNNLLTGVTRNDEPALGYGLATVFTPDCETYRPYALDQYLGVQGVTIPECTFTYTGP